jgi:hypothetical protein
VREARVVVRSDEVTAAEVRCRHEGPGWSQTEPVGRFGMVLVRSGLFRREVDGAEAIVDACAGYVQRPGSEQRIAHPAGGDVCTFVSLPAPEYEAVARGSVLAGDVPVLTTAEVDVRHRALVARCNAGAAPDELAERAVVLVGSVLAGLAPDAVAAGFPAARPARRVVDDVRQVLAAETGFADQAHLTRSIRRETGSTPAQLRALLAPGVHLT